MCVYMCVYIPFAQLWATSWLHYPRLFSLREQFIHRLYTVIFFYNELYQADPVEKILGGYYSRVSGTFNVDSSVSCSVNTQQAGG